MKFSEQWLREWVNPPIATEALAQQLTMAGLEVSSIEPVAGPFSGVMVGYVSDVQQHPDAERLRICQVDVGQPEQLSIICGASNVRPNIKVPVAVIGAIINPEFKIKKAKLRGIESQGMICSAQELGLAESSQGILILPDDAPLGVDFRHYWQLDDKAITVELTPNRGDCASIIGVARDVAALNQCVSKKLEIKPIAATHDAQIAITIETPEACPRYIGRVIHKVNNQVATPQWLAERLRRSGLRTINPIVDVLNYVMLELGQPMHAFDVAKISEGVVVRPAQAGEELKLLNEQTIKLSPEDLVIADQDKPLALAGIMGGSESEVKSVTQTVFLESAFFEPVTMAGKARRYGLHTDASYRFERGVNPALAGQAIERATELIMAMCGGQPGPVLERTSEQYLPKLPIINLRKARIMQVLGMTLPDSQIELILTRLDMQVSQGADGWQVQIPLHRFDIKLEIDLIEELARIYGYDKIAATPPHGAYTVKAASETQVELTRIQSLLVDRGYNEAITYSFVSPKLNDIFAQELPALKLSNPISAELSVMRNHLWPSLIAALQYNQNRQQERVRLFETGLRFSQENGQIQQQKVLAGISTGMHYPEQWAASKAKVDFFDVKADIEALLALTGHGEEFQFVTAEKAGLHPGQTAKILHKERLVGYVGAIHPSVAEMLDLNSAVYLFEIELAVLMQSVLPTYISLSKYPSIRRDIALIIEKHIPAASLLAKIQHKAEDVIKQVQVFDVYEGKGIPEGQKSIAISITMQHTQRTLTDQEINALMESIVTDLQQAFNVKLREG